MPTPLDPSSPVLSPFAASPLFAAVALAALLATARVAVHALGRRRSLGR